ncbi:hypothetical protein K438DRAFT_2051332 [Mycena galopus ATCC 62051]|nr:hypothetical protein K438DRAFT_2051332 [Mycena galopus ATCC 62051]
MPRRNSPGSGPGAPTVTVAEFFAALGAGHITAVAVSATTLGYAASIHRRARPPQHHRDRHRHRTPHRRASRPVPTTLLRPAYVQEKKVFTNRNATVDRQLGAGRAHLRRHVHVAQDGRTYGSPGPGIHFMLVTLRCPSASSYPCPCGWRSTPSRTGEHTGGASVLRVIRAGPAHDMQDGVRLGASCSASHVDETSSDKIVIEHVGLEDEGLAAVDAYGGECDGKTKTMKDS